MLSTLGKVYLTVALGVGILFTVGAFGKWKLVLPSGGGSGFGRSYGGSWGGGK